MLGITRVSPIRHKYNGWRGNSAVAGLTLLALIGVGLIGIATPALAQDPANPAVVKVALLLEPQAIELPGAAQVSESILAHVYGKGGVSSPSSAPAVADASSVTLWDEYLPKRTSSSATGVAGANVQAGLNVGRAQ